MLTTLVELAARRSTGALHLGTAPAATIYLRDGLIRHIDTTLTPDVGRLLLASGRLSSSVWETASAHTGRVGPMLVAEGQLSQGELELAALGALYDAAVFVLGARPTTVRFAEHEAPWLGAAVSVAVEPLWREVERRRRLLDAALPTAIFDTAPVRPAPRLSCEHLVLDGLRWELLVHADGRRGPVELAKVLGRAAFAAVLETRRMAAIGLLRPPRQAAPVPPTYGGTTSSPPGRSVPNARISPYRPPPAAV